MIDTEAIAWAYGKLLAFGVGGSNMESAMMLDRLNEMLHVEPALLAPEQSIKTAHEQVQEAKENNPDLMHWESNDPEAWDEAMTQDEILRTSSKWSKVPYADRFVEVVRRVRAILPEASTPLRAELDKAKP